MKDPVLQEVWKAKDDIAARHNYDVRQLTESLKAKERTSGHEILDLRTVNESSSKRNRSQISSS